MKKIIIKKLVDIIIERDILEQCTLEEYKELSPLFPELIDTTTDILLNLSGLMIVNMDLNFNYDGEIVESIMDWDTSQYGLTFQVDNDGLHYAFLDKKYNQNNEYGSIEIKNDFENELSRLSRLLNIMEESF